MLWKTMESSVMEIKKLNNCNTQSFLESPLIMKPDILIKKISWCISCIYTLVRNKLAAIFSLQNKDFILSGISSV